jgi:hypothetical protein
MAIDQSKINSLARQRGLVKGMRNGSLSLALAAAIPDNTPSILSFLQFGNYVDTPVYSGDQDNLTVAGLETSSVIRISSSNDIEVTGIGGHSPFKYLITMNVGTKKVKFKNNNVGSLAVNRFFCKGDLTLDPNEGGAFIYDGVSERWRCLGKF